MVFLLISIFASSCMYLCFKVISKNNLDTMSAILVNYLVCSVVSFVICRDDIAPFIKNSPNELLIGTVLLGGLFIGTFYLMGLATKLLGVAGSTIVSRMSMIIPSAYAIIFLGAGISATKILGFILALSAIYFIVHKKEKIKVDDSIKHKNNSLQLVWISILVFVGLGLTDTALKHLTHTYLNSRLEVSLMSIIFTTAMIIGLITRLKSKLQLTRKTVLWGGILGLCNVSSLYFFLKAMNDDTISASIFFPTNSVGIVLISTILSILIFKEKISRNKVLGMALSILAILLMNLP